MYELKIRKLPYVVEAKLKEEAKKQGIGVETYVRNLLQQIALHPEIKSTESKYTAFAKEIIALYQKSLEDVVMCVERNNYLLERILEEREDRE